MKTITYDSTFDMKAIETGRLVSQLKQFLLLNFEKTLAAALLAGTFLGAYFIQDAAVVLNFYYLPVLVAAYFLGRRSGLLVAIFSILLVVICALVFPARFLAYRSSLEHVSTLFAWGGFLMLTSITVGTLYEANDRRLQDLKNALLNESVEHCWNAKLSHSTACLWDFHSPDRRRLIDSFKEFQPDPGPVRAEPFSRLFHLHPVDPC